MNFGQDVGHLIGVDQVVGFVGAIASGAGRQKQEKVEIDAMFSHRALTFGGKGKAIGSSDAHAHP